MKKVFNKVLSLFIDLLLLVLLIFSVDTCIESAINKRDTTFTVSPIRVMSPSMEASGFNVGCITFIKPCDVYDVGDVVAFHYGNEVWFHEIIDIDNGYIQTKGSSNLAQDPFTINDSDIIGKQIGVVISNSSYYIFRVSFLIFLYAYVMRKLLLELYITAEKIKPLTRKIETSYKSKPVYSLTNKVCWTALILGSISLGILGVHSSTLQQISINGNIDYTAPVVVDTIIPDLEELLGDSDSSISEYFEHRRVGSKIDSGGYKWAPKVIKELSSMTGCSVDELEDCSWVVLKTNTGYNIFYTDIDVSSLDFQDSLDAVYRYVVPDGDMYVSTASVGLSFSEFPNYFNTISIFSYDYSSETIC